MRYPLILFAVLAALGATAQPATELTIRSELRRITEGSEAVGLAYDPQKKIYYSAVIATTTTRPGSYLIGFSAQGKRLSGEEPELAGWRLRSLWWDANSKGLAGNGYNDEGWARIHTGKDSATGTSLLQGMHQPDEQSSGALNSAAGEVYFLKGQMVHVYAYPGGTRKEPIRLHIGSANAAEASENADEHGPDNLMTQYNQTLLYTGWKEAEFGLLNTERQQIELYSRTTGYRTRILRLPKQVHGYPFFNLAFTNGMFWIYNVELGSWRGMK